MERAGLGLRALSSETYVHVDSRRSAQLATRAERQKPVQSFRERSDRFTIDSRGVAMGNPVKSGAAMEMIRTVGQWQVPALGAGT
jgi:hypothetical protein